jgi:hypothetical protein
VAEIGAIDAGVFWYKKLGMGFLLQKTCPGKASFLWQVFVKSSFVETKGGHGIHEKVLSKRSDINKTPRNVVTEGIAPLGRSAASHRRKTEASLY